MKKRVKNDVKSSNMAHKKLSGLFLNKNQEALKNGKKEDMVALTKYIYHENVINEQSRKGRILTKREREDLYVMSAHTVGSAVLHSPGDK
ncbi:MAG: hypothetical protein E7353_06815 [Clostridiales bacterium]|nr:hypothetical protein [Clostridiales bacterium]